MNHSKTNFFCTECGNESPKWQGRCPACGAWNSLVEEPGGKKKVKGSSGPKAIGSKPAPITSIPSEDNPRIVSSIGEFDRILGGGLVPGAVTLLGGEPGVGKSTLMLQVACTLASLGNKVLYVTGEESSRQIRMRADRLDACHENLFIFCETDVDAIIEGINTVDPQVVVVDSIQTLGSADIASAPGSVSQIRENAARLVRVAKDSDRAVFFIGHVTKEGVVAGPRLLEHMVDTVLYFEGERHFSYRILRAVKNRFGSTNEIGIFEMTEKGLSEIANPSEMFLPDRPHDAAGSVILAAIEGSRPLLVEVQALVSPNGGYGAPRRSAHGMDAKRLALLLAVLEKRLGLPLSTQDVFVNIAGGLHIEEPALDLAVAAAVASSALDIAVERDTVVFGEVGLAGETRSVGQVQKRIHEAKRLGFKACIYGAPRNEKPGVEKDLALYPASALSEALNLLGLRKTKG